MDRLQRINELHSERNENRLKMVGADSMRFLELEDNEKRIDNEILRLRCEE